jgi:K+:H+ antiporter
VTYLKPHDLTVIFFALAVLLGVAKVAGELMRKIQQPSILGEISAGILLGPTVLGHFHPTWYAAIFPSTGSVPIVLETIATLAVVFFLLAAGLETRLRSVFRQGKSALFASLLGLIFPFVTGFLAAYLFPRFLGAEHDANGFIFAVFIGTALSISALPVIAKILMDLNLLQTELGSVVMSAVMFDDLVGWILFGVVLRMIGAGSGSTVLRTIILVALFVTVTLTLGRWLIAKVIRLIRSHTTGRGADLCFVFSLTLAAGGTAEYAGIHAIFGGFIVGIAAGDSLDTAVTQDIRGIITNVLAPLFFVSIGLRTNFAANFRLGATLILIAVACLGKILGASWGARLGGMDARSSWAVGLAMNARGAMEIVLGVLALHAGLIAEPTFVALVVMALVTSLISAPLIHALMNRMAPPARTAQAIEKGDCQRLITAPQVIYSGGRRR